MSTPQTTDKKNPEMQESRLLCLPAVTTIFSISLSFWGFQYSQMKKQMEVTNWQKEKQTLIFSEINTFDEMQSQEFLHRD